jgi:hypothetical protein
VVFDHAADSVDRDQINAVSDERHGR